jgi:hypothetical protein
MMINIREVKGGTNMDVNDRKEERKRIKDIFKTLLRQRYPGLIGLGESFNALWRDDEQNSALALAPKRRQLRTAYEVLCFLRLAPLTLYIEERKRIFNPIIRKAYNLMEARKTTNIPGA